MEDNYTDYFMNMWGHSIYIVLYWYCTKKLIERPSNIIPSMKTYRHQNQPSASFSKNTLTLFLLLLVVFFLFFFFSSHTPKGEVYFQKNVTLKQVQKWELKEKWGLIPTYSFGIYKIQCLILSPNRCFRLCSLFALLGLRATRNDGRRRPLIWDHKKISWHCFPEPLLVLLGRDYSRRCIFRTTQDARSLHPCLEVLIPCVLPHKINYSQNQLLIFLIHPNQ